MDRDEVLKLLTGGEEGIRVWNAYRERGMDFSPWKTKAFDETFGKLVRGLKVNYGPKDPPTS